MAHRNRPATMAKPRVILQPVASHCAARGERIVEFSSLVGGGLISLRVINGRLRVEVYRADDTVDLIGPGMTSLGGENKARGSDHELAR